MKKLLTILSLILVIALTAGILCTALAEGKTNTVYLNVRLNRNVILARNPVTVCMDGTEIGTISQGNLLTMGIVLSEGKHRLTFRQESAIGGKEGEWIIGVLPDQSFISCTVQTHTLFVEVKDHSVTTIDGKKVMQQTDSQDAWGHVVDIVEAIF